ncbi:MAG: peptidoglycan editing factor PgeF [Clostridia bacterium]|nr:peptidoglycan editing factor PgeF [Clostridia bacterium]
MSRIEKDYTNHEVTHIKKGDIEYLQFKKLNEYSDKLFHAITLRHGGVSANEYTSLNFRSTGYDSKENVLKNLARICDATDINKNKIYKGKQAHTSNILLLNNDNKEPYQYENFCEEEYDGYVTNIVEIGTLVTVADCNCIILYDPVNNVIANIHSGWKGTIEKITIKAINLMIQQYHSKVEDLICCFGPSIRKCCFSSEEQSFQEKFTTIWKNEEEYITHQGKRFYIDLIYVITKDLLKIGLKNENIVDSHICTMCHSDDFFSNRACKKQNFKDFGTLASITMLK